MASANYGGTLVSTIIGLIGSIISAYFFYIGKLNFENLIWIAIGLIFFIGIMVYQDIRNELDDQKWEQKRLNEKLKIYERIVRLEDKVFK